MRLARFEGNAVRTAGSVPRLATLVLSMLDSEYID